ncbi:hypothetical protein MMPV_001591 [Pyropia vietnamensis]
MDTLVPTNRARSAIVSFLGGTAAATEEAGADAPPPEPQLHAPRPAAPTNDTDVRMRGSILAARRRSGVGASRRSGADASRRSGGDDEDDDVAMADGAASRTNLLGVRGGRVGKALPRGRSSVAQKAREAARIAAGQAAADRAASAAATRAAKEEATRLRRKEEAKRARVDAQKAAAAAEGATPMEVTGTPDERLAAALLAAKRQRRKATRTRSRQKNLRKDTRRGPDLPAHLSADTLAGGRLAPGEPIFRTGVLENDAEA